METRKMKMKVAVVASLLLVSVQTASAEYYYVNPYSGPNSFYYQYYWDSPAAEDDLAYLRDLEQPVGIELRGGGCSPHRTGLHGAIPVYQGKEPGIL
jgi:hypothetical protein